MIVIVMIMMICPTSNLAEELLVVLMIDFVLAMQEWFIMLEMIKHYYILAEA